MKKALSVFLMLALVGSVFAAEPVADVNIAEFKGDASVQWGVNFDTGKTGFKNSADVTLKLNLLNEGSKSTTGDGVWGELVIKTDGDTFAKATNTSNIALPAMKVVVDTAKIHFGPAYIGITSGDTQTGKLKMDAAIKSADSDNAVTVPDVGPGNYSQGITLGYDHDMFSVAADVRSFGEVYSFWHIETNGPGVAMSVLDPVKYAGVLTDVKNYHFIDETEAKRVAGLLRDNYAKAPVQAGYTVEVVKDGDFTPAGNQYNNAYAFALEGEVKPIENLSIKAGVSYNYKMKNVDYIKIDMDDPVNPEVTAEKKDLDSILGYSASVGYKMALNDTFYLRPQVGFAGFNNFTTKVEADKSGYTVAGGLLFGWGEIGIDDNAGVYFLDDDAAKKVSPGVGIVVSAPIKEGATITIAPSFFSGDIIPGLTAAAYSKIDVTTGDNVTVGYELSNGMKYAIPVGAGTITPQVGAKITGSDSDAFATLNVKAGMEVGGFVDNTTFFTVYESGDLLKEEAGKSKPGLGTLNFGAKISF